MFETLNRAIDLRNAMGFDSTDAYRIVDGVGDGLPGITIDRFADAWLVQTPDQPFPSWLRDYGGLPGSTYWKKLGDAGRKASPELMLGRRIESPFVAIENGTSYWIDFSAGYSQGLFIDQRNNREKLREITNGSSVLNCFAYTCSFGVVAAMKGAKTVNIDLSKHYLEWGKRNYELNRVPLDNHQFLFGDVGDWLARFCKKNARFDVVILDPPTFSRNRDGKVFRVETDFGELIRAATQILSPAGTILCSTNLRGISREYFKEILISQLPDPARWNLSAVPMPSDFRGDRYLKSFWVRGIP
jgi:23S rRNA (cytosine1962-C5)-methyltransferase